MSVYQGPGCKSEDNHLGRLVIKCTFWAECQRFNKLNFVRQKKGLSLTVAQRSKQASGELATIYLDISERCFSEYQIFRVNAAGRSLEVLCEKEPDASVSVNETQNKLMLTLTRKLSSGRRDSSRGALHLSMMLHIYHESKNHVLHCGCYVFNPSMGEEDIDKSVSSGLRSRPCL